MKFKNTIKYLLFLHKIYKVRRKLNYLNLCKNSQVYKNIEHTLKMYGNANYTIQQCFNVDGKIYIYITENDSVFISKQNKSITYNHCFKANFVTNITNYLNKLNLSSLPKLKLNTCFSKDDDIRFKFCSFSTIDDSLNKELNMLQKQLNLLQNC